MAITTGVGAEVIRNIFVNCSSVDSVTPICGLIGYMLGYYMAKSQTKWKYYQKERVHMLGVMLLMFLLYLQLSYYYRNISFFSMMVAFGLGFIFYFCDPDEKYDKYRIWAIILLILLIGGAGGCLFFNVNPPLVATWYQQDKSTRIMIYFELISYFPYFLKLLNKWVEKSVFILSLVFLEDLIVKEIVSFVLRIHTFRDGFFTHESWTGEIRLSSWFFLQNYIVFILLLEIVVENLQICHYLFNR